MSSTQTAPKTAWMDRICRTLNHFQKVLLWPLRSQYLINLSIWKLLLIFQPKSFPMQLKIISLSVLRKGKPDGQYSINLPELVTHQTVVFPSGLNSPNSNNLFFSLRSCFLPPKLSDFLFSRRDLSSCNYSMCVDVCDGVKY